MATNQPKIKPAKSSPQGKSPDSSPGGTPPIASPPTQAAEQNQQEERLLEANPNSPSGATEKTPQEQGTMPPGETAQIPGTPQESEESLDQKQMEEKSETEEQREALLRAERIREKARKQLENLQTESQPTETPEQVETEEPGD